LNTYFAPRTDEKDFLMDASIPPSIQPLIDAYLRALEPLRGRFYGIYIYGSIALGAFEEAMSDIDVIALTQGAWSPQELKQLKALHMRLIAEQPWGKRLEVQYLPASDLGKSKHEAEIAPYPSIHDGRFSPGGYGDLNSVTWWTLKRHGIRLLGPEPAELSFDVAWRQVLQTMRFNLNVYFVGKLKQPYIYLDANAVEFAVTNLCRILSTIEDGAIVSKSASLKIWRKRLSPRWQRLLDEASRVRHQLDRPSYYRFRLWRMWEVVAFIRYVRERGGKALNAMDGV
jgi:predicted nucleotidyltransferase